MLFARWARTLSQTTTLLISLVRLIKLIIGDLIMKMRIFKSVRILLWARCGVIEICSICLCWLRLFGVSKMSTPHVL